MRRLMFAAAAVAIFALPLAASADPLTGAAIGAGTGAVIAGPPGAIVGGVAGAVIGGPNLGHRHRHCWWSRGHHYCNWR